MFITRLSDWVTEWLTWLPSYIFRTGCTKGFRALSGGWGGAEGGGRGSLRRHFVGDRALLPLFFSVCGRWGMFTSVWVHTLQCAFWMKPPKKHSASAQLCLSTRKNAGRGWEWGGSIISRSKKKQEKKKSTVWFYNVSVNRSCFFDMFFFTF